MAVDWVVKGCGVDHPPALRSLLADCTLALRECRVQEKWFHRSLYLVRAMPFLQMGVVGWQVTCD